jgi:acetolactate synthase I/II/III large subunit
MKLSGARILLESLRLEGVDVIFGLPGGAILPIYDVLHDFQGLRHILVRHEASAAHAADGYARVSGKPGVALVTSGPAVTNLVTGLQSAHMDSIPIVAFTGQVPTKLIGRDAFQEADNIGLTRPCTKHNFLVRDPADLARTVKEAFHIATTGRPGPVHVDLPKDVLIASAEFNYPESVDLRGYRPVYEGHVRQIEKAAHAIHRAKRPVLLVGGGVVASNAAAELRMLAEQMRIPVVMTLMGLGCLPTTHPLSMGMLGMHGSYWANMAVHESDCLIAVGARFDDRVTGEIDRFCPNAEIVQIDIDPSSISKNLKADIPIVGDARRVLTKLLAALKDPAPGHREEWLVEIARWRAEHPLSYERDDNIIKPQYVIQEVSRLSGPDAIVVTGVGQHQMWAAQYLAFQGPRRWCTSGGLGAMGYGLPAALGAQAAAPDRLVINVDGDGSFVMSSIELATAVASKLPVKTILLNNGVHGMVRQWQEIVYGERYCAVDLTGSPDFVKLAEAYGCTGMRATRPSELAAVLEQAFATPGPVVVDVVVDEKECVFPFVLPGQANTEMLLAKPKRGGSTS